MLTKLKKQIQEMLTSEAKIAHKMGLTPNHISVIGFLLAIGTAASYALTNTNSLWLLFLAVFFMMASGFCDAMDGIVARTFQQTSKFGGFFDSVLDRFADATSYAGIIIAGLCNPAFGAYWGIIVTLAALIASMLVSYTRSRAEAIGVKMESVGIAERAERMLILAAVSIIGFWYLPALGYGVALIAVLSIVTVLQRVWHVYKELKKEKTVKTV
jgi:archaetidylinositol phosphate synthase